MRILGLETSCDDTGAAVFDDRRGLLCHLRASQVETHRPHGGVVPELAARDHVRKLTPLVRATLAGAETEHGDIDGVAYTAGPGLIGALLVAAAVGRALAYAWQVPAVGIHHLEGHLLSPQLETSIDYPFLALLVSGGHTMLVDVAAPGRYTVLGNTLDDAVGEAFDKTAKLLGLGYPGGPAIATEAERGRAGRFAFPRPMTDRPGLAFSFSGLKTSVVHTVSGLTQPLDAPTRADLARAFEDAAVDTLLIKTRRALQASRHSRLVIAGGVGANQTLRNRMMALGAEHAVDVYFPRLEFCTDNGAMIAYAGWLRLAAGQQQDLAIEARARWPLEDLTPLPAQ